MLPSTDIDKGRYPKWPHLENFGKHPGYLGRAPFVTITEKIHGFNGRFGRTRDGEFWVGGRNEVAYADLKTSRRPEGELQGFVSFAYDRRDTVPPGFTFFGEWAGKGIQKGIDYGDKKFFLFGITVAPEAMAENHGLLYWEAIPIWAQNLGVPTVPLLYNGQTDSLKLEQLLTWSTQASTAGEGETEGIVMSAEPFVVDDYRRLLIIKFKNPKFAERVSEKTVREPVNMDNVNGFAVEFVTEERLHHVLALVAEANGLPDEQAALDFKFMGNVLQTFFKDVTREGAEEFAALSDDDRKMAGKAINAMVKPMMDEMRNEALRAAQPR